MTNRSTLYGALKLEHSRRENARRTLANHPDADKVITLHTKTIAAIISDYQAAGGKRDVEKYR